MRMKVAIAALLALAGCATARPRGARRRPSRSRSASSRFNDFHGALQPPRYADSGGRAGRKRGPRAGRRRRLFRFGDAAACAPAIPTVSPSRPAT